MKQYDLSRFCKKSSNRDGLSNQCRKCMSVKNLNWRLKNKDTKRHVEYNAKNSKKRYSYVEKWRKDNPLKVKAHYKVSQALKSGDLIKRSCELCGSLDSEAHHEDYNRPLEVNWLCKSHHKIRHDQLRSIAK